MNASRVALGATPGRGHEVLKELSKERKGKQVPKSKGRKERVTGFFGRAKKNHMSPARRVRRTKPATKGDTA